MGHEGFKEAEEWRRTGGHAKAAKKQRMDTNTVLHSARCAAFRAFEHVVFRVTHARPARLGVIGHHCPTTTTCSSCRIPQQRQQGSRRRTSSRRPTPKVRSRCRRNSATLLHACLASALALTHLIQRPYRFPRALSGAIKASYAGRPSVRTVSAATRSSIARATCKAQWQKDFWCLLLACVVVPRFRIRAMLRAVFTCDECV